jgi:hypothetical protein
MGIIEDVFSALDRIPIWKRLQGIPVEVDGLKARIAALEEQLGGKWPADVCKYCGERAVRMHSKHGPIIGGKMNESWKCEECGKFDKRLT